jgi:hypothetical protein
MELSFSCVCGRVYACVAGSKVFCLSGVKNSASYGFAISHYDDVHVATTLHYDEIHVATTLHYDEIHVATTLHYDDVHVATTLHYDDVHVATTPYRSHTIFSIYILPTRNRMQEDNIGSYLFQGR